MSLTDPALLFALAILTVGVFGWNVVAWPRSAGPGLPAVLRRIARQLGVVVLVLLTVGVALNDQYDWYANWGDLTTSFSANIPEGTTVTGGVAAKDAAGAVVAAPSPDDLAARPEPPWPAVPSRPSGGHLRGDGLGQVHAVRPLRRGPWDAVEGFQYREPVLALRGIGVRGREPHRDGAGVPTERTADRELAVLTVRAGVGGQLQCPRTAGRP